MKNNVDPDEATPLLQELRSGADAGFDDPNIESIWQPSHVQGSLALTTPPNHLHVVCLWSGVPDIEVCESAIEVLVQRHSALRTRYLTDQAGRLWAVTERRRRIPVDLVDLCGVPESEREIEARRVALQRARAPFELHVGPLFRVTLMRLTADHVVSVFVVHHSVFDGLSVDIFFSELLSLYHAHRSGTTLTLP